MLPPSHHLPLLWYPSYLCLFKFLLSNHLIFASWIKCSSHSPNGHLFGLFRNQPLHYFLVRSGNALYIIYAPPYISVVLIVNLIVKLIMNQFYTSTYLMFLPFPISFTTFMFINFDISSSAALLEMST